MKQLLIFLTLIISSQLTAQETIEKIIGEFSTVKVYDLINLKMKKSNENKVIISGKNKGDVQVVNKNGKLKIRMHIEESYDGNDTVVILHYTSVDIIDANEGANVIVEDVLEQYDIDLKTQEGAEIKAQLKTTYASFRAVTGGVINVSGTTKNQKISIYTGGEFNGEDLQTQSTDVSINAGGEAYVNASDRVEVKVKAGGDVFIYGKPKLIDEKRVLGGRIKRM